MVWSVCVAGPSLADPSLADQSWPDPPFPDPSWPDRSWPDPSWPDPSWPDQSCGDQSCGDQPRLRRLAVVPPSVAFSVVLFGWLVEGGLLNLISTREGGGYK